MMVVDRCVGGCAEQSADCDAESRSSGKALHPWPVAIVFVARVRGSMQLLACLAVDV
jgi:hypothetical protein